MHTDGRVNPFVNRKALVGGGREVFLARVRKGLGHDEGRSPAPTEQPVRDEALVRQVGANDAGRVARFVEKAKGNTMVVNRVKRDAGEIHRAMDASFANHKITRCVVNVREMDEVFGVSEHLEKKGIERVMWGTAGCKEEAFTCEASITDCRGGLADTGALLVWSDVTFGRCSTLVVPVHVVLLPESKVLGDMIDGLELARKENGGGMPSNVVVINGPSKTGDIEMKLVTGVHGPKFLYVVLIEGM